MLRRWREMAGEVAQLGSGLSVMGSDIAALFEEGARAVVVYRDNIKAPADTQREDILFVALESHEFGELINALTEIPDLVATVAREAAAAITQRWQL